MSELSLMRMRKLVRQKSVYFQQATTSEMEFVYSHFLPDTFEHPH